VNTIAINGLLHIHSSYSYDGEVSLQQLRDLCKNSGYKFITLTEHAKNMSKDKMKMLVLECNSLSSADLTFIPGLEFDCDGDYHILALGIEEYIETANPKEVISKIHELGGIAILAHVSYYDRIPYDVLASLDGIEIWNIKYDGKYAPKLKNFKILKKFKEINPNIICYGGLDLHEINEFKKLLINVRTRSVDSKDSKKILTALKAGNFHITNGLFIIGSKGNLESNIIKFIIFILLFNLLVIAKIVGRKIFKATNTKPPKIFLDWMKRIFL
jgi:hypothetical protein